MSGGGGYHLEALEALVHNASKGEKIKDTDNQRVLIGKILRVSYKWALGKHKTLKSMAPLPKRIYLVRCGRLYGLQWRTGLTVITLIFSEVSEKVFLIIQGLKLDDVQKQALHSGLPEPVYIKVGAIGLSHETGVFLSHIHGLIGPYTQISF